MNKILLIALLTMLCLVGSSYAQPPTDTLFFKNLHVTQAVVSNHLHGVELVWESTYQDKSTGLNKRDNRLLVYLLGKDGNLLPTRSTLPDLRNPPGYLCITNDMQLKRGVNVSHQYAFIPYYALPLAAGEYQFTLRPKLSYGLLGNELAPIVVYRDSARSVPISMPSLVTFKLSVVNLEVENTNLNGKPWDQLPTLAKKDRSLPDLTYRFKLESLKTTEELVKAPVQENTLQAGWEELSTTITMAENDQLGIYLEDQDEVRNNDRIGLKYLTFAELQAASDNKTELQFDRVRKLVLQVQLITAGK